MRVVNGRGQGELPYVGAWMLSAATIGLAFAVVAYFGS